MQVVRVGGGGVFIHNLNCKRGGPGIPIESVHYHDVADERVCVSVEHPGAPFITNNEWYSRVLSAPLFLNLNPSWKYSVKFLTSDIQVLRN